MSYPACRKWAGKGGYKMKIEEARCVGGLADEMKSNGGTQYYQQERVYVGDIALALPASLPDGSYKYIVGGGAIYEQGR